MLARQPAHCRKSSWLACLAAGVLISGCATSPEENDPSEGGFWRGVQGVSGGQYEERIREREDRITREQQHTQELSRRYNEILAEQAEVEKRTAEIKSRIRTIEREIQRLENNLVLEHAENQELALQLEEAKERVRLFRESSMDQPMTFDELEASLAELSQIEEIARVLTASL